MALNDDLPSTIRRTALFFSFIPIISGCWGLFLYFGKIEEKRFSISAINNARTAFRPQLAINPHLEKGSSTAWASSALTKCGCSCTCAARRTARKT